MTDPAPNLRNEAVDFMYKHGDLTFSAAYAAVDKLCGNGFYITRTPTPAPNAGAVKVKPLVGWVIANGQGNRWRCVWKWETNAEWTDDISMAIKFATRDDAEAFSADDEDAWLIQEVSIPAIEPHPDPRDAVIARLVEAAELADAAHRGANMNMNVVQAKMSAALASAKEVLK